MQRRRNDPLNLDPNGKSPQSRVNYEDHSLRFLDWVDRMGLQQTPLGRMLIHLEEKLQFRRLAVIFVFALLLALTITFEVETDQNYQVGDIAKVDIISTVSFEMIDQVNTEEKRLKAENSVPVIFDFDPAVFDRVSSAVYRSFRMMRGKLKTLPWPKSLAAQEEFIKDFFVNKAEFEKDLGVSVPDFLFEWLVQNRFNVRIENAVIHNALEKWYANRIAENIDKMVPGSQSVILARTLTKNNLGREFPVEKASLLEASNPDNFLLEPSRGFENPSDRDFIKLQAFARLLIYPNLTLNKQEMQTRKQAARDSVLPTSVSVKKGQAIVQEGTVIQPMHMSILKRIAELRSEKRQDIFTVALALVFIAVILVFFQYLRRFSTNKVVIEDKDIFVMGLVTLFVVAVTKVFIFTTENAFLAKFGAALPASVFLFAAPVASAPMLVGLLIQSGEVVWLFCAFVSIVIGMMSDMNLPLMVTSFVGGIAAARGVYNCKKRNDIYRAGLRTGIVNAMLIVLLTILVKMDQPGFARELLYNVPAGFLGGIFSSLIAMMAVPLLESTFNYTTDVKLLELSNLNHPLLKEMIVKAPGTYHHSMLVGSMVEAAAEEIGANPLLGKVMCYYHDIGKMAHANYFIENQKPGQNPHDHISPYMSKTLLVAHVKDGVELGVAHHLGKPIIDGVVQHHGTTLISYFFNKALDLKGDEDVEVSEEEFRYPGPKPQFREAALCMLADSIEAASRSLDEPTPVRLQNIVRNIVQRKFMEGQLDECSLTLKDLGKVEVAFTRILLGIYHQRIDYPKSAGGGASESPAQSFFSINGQKS